MYFSGSEKFKFLLLLLLLLSRIYIYFYLVWLILYFVWLTVYFKKFVALCKMLPNIRAYKNFCISFLNFVGC